MKRLNRLSENVFLQLFFTYLSLCFLAAAFLMPDRADMLPGFWRILSSPTKASTNFFSVGGYAATFLNMGLVGLICTGPWASRSPTPWVISMYSRISSSTPFVLLYFLPLFSLPTAWAPD